MVYFTAMQKLFRCKVGTVLLCVTPDVMARFGGAVSEELANSLRQPKASSSRATIIH